MGSDVIDTLEIAHELRQAGLPEPQADVIARLFKRRYDADREELVTRAYLDAALDRQSADVRAALELHSAEVKAALDRQSGEVKAALDRQSAEVKAELERQWVEVRTELARQSTEVRAELGRHSAEVNAAMARLERDPLLKLGGIVTLAVAIIGGLGVLF